MKETKQQFIEQYTNSPYRNKIPEGKTLVVCTCSDFERPHWAAISNLCVNDHKDLERTKHGLTPHKRKGE